MSQADDNSKLLTYLDSLESALQEGNPADVLAFLRVLRMNGLQDERSATLVAVFSDDPQPSDFDRVQAWAATQRERLQSGPGPSAAKSSHDPFADGDFVSVADEVSDLDDLEGDSGLDAFVSVDDDDLGLHDFDVGDDISIEELDELDDSDGDDPFVSVDSPSDAEFDEVSPTAQLESLSSSDEISSAPDSSESFAPVESSDLGGVYGADHTPPPPDEPGTGGLAEEFDSEPSYSLSPKSTITGEREKTRQLDGNHLQALSKAASIASDGADSPSADKAPGGDKNIHEQPTKRQFKAESDTTVGDDIKERETVENFKVESADEAPADVSHEAFDLGIGAGSDQSSNTDDGDDFDFDLSPESSSTDDGDDFDFDLSPESSSTDDGDDDLDFALSPESSSTTSESQAMSTTDSDPPSIDESMGYAEPPEDTSFFPPPLNEKDSGSTDTNNGSSASPFPESPSYSGEPRIQSSADDSDNRSQRPDQPTPMMQSADAESLQQKQETPARGVTPLPSGAPSSTAEEGPLPEDELLALGEELSSGASSSAPEAISQPSAEEPEKPAKNRKKPSYRGEPVIRELGDEPTPDRPIAEDAPTGHFSSPEGGSEETNPFSQDEPTGVRQQQVGVIDQSSFILEEVEESDTAFDSPEEAIEAALDQARALYEKADFNAAMDLIEDVLEAAEDSERAHELKGLVEGELERKLTNKLGSLTATPTLSISMGELSSLDLDHRAGFLLSQIDGILCIEDILDMSAMSRLETLTVLVDLHEQSVIAID